MTEPDLNTLLEENISLVYSIARSRFPSHAADPDLLQCGMIGLWEAAERWNGVTPFPAFARPCIYHNMIDYLRRAKPAEEPLKEQEAPSDEDARISEMDLSARICRALPQGRERELLLALADGMSKRALADRLGLTGWELTRKARAAWNKVRKKGGPE